MGLFVEEEGDLRKKGKSRGDNIGFNDGDSMGLVCIVSEI